MVFGAKWSQESQAMVALLKRTAKKMDIDRNLKIFDWDDDRKMIDKYNIFGFPTLLVIQNKIIVERVSGTVSEQDIKCLIQKYQK